MFEIKTAGEKPHKCNTCGARFSDRSHLNRHIGTHTGEKPHKCDTCSARFLNRSHLERHIRTHTGEKHYTCDTCGAQFADRRHPYNHTGTHIHTDETPYECETCDSKFSQICSRNVNEISVQDSSMPFNYTEHEATRTLGGHELINVEQGMTTDPDECCGNKEVATQWAVFPGGMLKQVKPEHNLHTFNREVPRSWVVGPDGDLKEAKTEHNE